MGLFGDLIRDKRKSARMNQAELCKLVNKETGGIPKLTQSRLSDWERGKSSPNPDNELQLKLIQRVAKMLTLDTETLVSSCRTDKNRSAVSAMDEDDYLFEVRRYVSELNHQVSFWFFGPRATLRKDLPPLRQEWVANLSIGIDHHIVWFLDGTRQEDIRFFAYESSEIVQVLGRGKGASKKEPGIIHHAYRISDKFGDYDGTQSIYETLRSEFIDHPVIKLNKVKYLNTDFPGNKLRLFLSFSQRFLSVMLVRPKNERIRPLAGVEMFNVRSGLFSSAQNVFGFLNTDKTLELLRLTELMER